MNLICLTALFDPLFAFSKEFWVNNQQAERLPFFFSPFGMVSAMSSQNSFGIVIIELPKPFETLMNVYIMNKKIDQTVNRDADTDE